MNKTVNKKFKDIKDVYLLQCICTEQYDEIKALNNELIKYKKRCYDALKLIRDNYGLLDKYGIDLLDDILNGR